MPYFELQIGTPEFRSIVEIAASRMTNPIARLNFLPPGVLVTGIQYTGGIDLSEVIDGVAILHAPVTITYTTFADFEADPTSQGTTFSDPTSVEIHVGFVGLKLQVSVVAVLDMATMVRESLPSPAIVQSLDLTQQLSGVQDVPLTLGAVVWDGGDVIAARVGDSLPTVSPLGLIGGIMTDPVADQRTGVGAGWALVLSGQLLAEVVTNQFDDQLTAQLAQPDWDHHVWVEKWPSAQWGQSPDQPNVFGLAVTFTMKAYGISVDVNIFIDFAGDVTITTQHQNASIDLVVHVAHHTSPGDVFLDELAAVLSGGAVPVLGWAAVVLLPGVIYSVIDGFVANQQLTGLTKQATPDSGDDATYTSSIPLKPLFNSQATEVDVTSTGVVVNGPFSPLPLPLTATHSPQFSPTTITGTWGGHYDCQQQGWIVEYDMTPLYAFDQTIFPAPLGASSQPAIIFDAVTVPPDAPWTWTSIGTYGLQMSPAGGIPNPGDSGTLYLHTSAGMGSVPIDPVPPQPPDPTPAELADAWANCQRAVAAWPTHFDLRWLIDPGPYENVLRLWMIEINTISAGTSLQIDDHTHEPALINGSGSGEAVQFVTAPADTVSVTIIGDGEVTANLHQWLLTIDATFDLGADVLDLALSPTGHMVALTSTAATTFDEQLRPAVRTETSSASTGLPASATGAPQASPISASNVSGLGRQFVPVRRGFVLVADGTNVHLARPVRTLTNVGV